MIIPEARAAIDRDIAYLRARAAPDVVDRWFTGLIDAIRSLSTMPKRCSLIPEHWMFEDEFRHLLYGSRRHQKRIIIFFESNVVNVVHYRHGSLPPLSLDEQDSPPELDS